MASSGGIETRVAPGLAKPLSLHLLPLTSSTKLCRSSVEEKGCVTVQTPPPPVSPRYGQRRQASYSVHWECVCRNVWRLNGQLRASPIVTARAYYGGEPYPRSSEPLPTVKYLLTGPNPPLVPTPWRVCTMQGEPWSRFCVMQLLNVELVNTLTREYTALFTLRILTVMGAGAASDWILVLQPKM